MTDEFSRLLQLQHDKIRRAKLAADSGAAQPPTTTPDRLQRLVERLFAPAEPDMEILAALFYLRDVADSVGDYMAMTESVPDDKLSKNGRAMRQALQVLKAWRESD